MVRHTEASAIFSIARQKRNAKRGSGRQRAMTATALSGGMLAALLIATPALAQQGGAGGTGGYANGGAGGEAGQPGGMSVCMLGPDPLCQTPGGDAGAEPGGRGGDGHNTGGNGGPGGGGGGGANGSLVAPIGGDGGNGGNGDSGNYSTGGGGGGGGGNGVILAGPLSNAGIVAGGNGGNGGNAGPTYFSAGPANGGSGGEGGTAIIGSAGAVITNLSAGSIRGGNGGVGGAGSSAGGVAGAKGAGGVAIRGADIYIENAGNIAGGLGGDGVTRALALHFTGGSNTLGMLAGGSITGDILLDTGSSLTFDVAGNETLGNVISGGGSIAKSGAGTLILAGTNSYTGSTTVNDGTLQIGALANISSGAIEWNGGSLRTTFDGTLANQLYWNSGATGTLAAATGTTLTLTGTLNFASDAELRFGGATDTGTIIASFFTGSVASPARIVIGGGTFQAGNGFMSLVLSMVDAVQVDAGATLDIHGAQPSTTLNSLEGAGTLLNDGATTVIAGGDFAGTLSGTQNLVKFSPQALILSGDNDYSGTTLVAGGVLQIGDGGTSGTLPGDVTVSTGAVLAFARSDAITVSSVIDGDGSVEQAGPGVLTLAGANTYTGGTTITGGLISFAGTGNFGSGNITLNGGGLQWATGNTTDISARFNGFGTNGGVFDTNGNDVTLASDLSGGGLTKLGSGLLTLTGSNSFVDTVTVGGGTLLRGSADALGGAGIVLAGGTLDLGGYDLQLRETLGVTGTGTIVSSGTQILTTASGEDTVFGSDGGAITSSLGISVVSGSTLTMFGNNDLTGNILLAGKLVIGETGAAGGAGNLIGMTGAVVGYADGVDNTATILIASDTAQFEVLGSDVATQSGQILQNPGHVRAFEKIGTGTLVLAGTAGYTGTTTVTAGTLGLSDASSISTAQILLANGTRLLNASCGCGTFALTNAIDIAAGGSATIDAGGNDTVLSGNLTGGNLIVADSIGGRRVFLTGTNSYGDTIVEAGAALIIGDGGTTGTLGTGSITTGALSLFAFNRSDTVTLGTAVTGDGILGLFGTGTLILTAANSYTGGTNIYGPDSTLQVGNGGTIGALGTGNISIAGGTLIFDRSDDVTIADSIRGLGQITKLGAGTLTLSGDNIDSQNTGFGPYFGSFSIQGGTLAVGEFGLGDADLVEIYSGATLKTLAHSELFGDVTIFAGGGTIDTGAFNLEMMGAVDFQGELTKTGSGMLLIDDRFQAGTGAGGINVTGGTVALGSDFAAGTGIIKLANGTTLRNATCNCIALAIDNEIQIAPAGTANFDGASFDTNLNGVISGGNAHFVSSVSVPYVWASFFLNAANTYRDSLIGPNVELVVTQGNLGTGDVRFDSAPSAPTTPSALIFRNATDYSFGGKIVGAGIISGEADPDSKITLTGSNTSTDNFTGKMEVFSGKLVINGDFGDVVNNSATLRMIWGGNGGATTASLGGSGTFHGNVALDNAELNPGNSPGTLTIAGNLTLGAGSILNFELGEPGTPGGASNDLVNVGGSLTLDGTLNTIASGAGYGPGYYRLFNYGGTLTDNGLSIGSIAGGLNAEVRTNINGQVNVRLGGAQAIQYWDGADMGATVGVTGGAGTWNSANTNWTGPTGYAINDSWRGQVGVFAGSAGGTVIVEGTQAFEELRFETDGYVLRPVDANARLATTGGFSVIDVASGITTDIGVVIQGNAGLDKTGTGTLLLSAANTYTGATDVAAGTLRVGIDNAIGMQSTLNVQAGATFDLAGFTTRTGALAGAGTITLNNGRLETGYNHASTIFSGTLTGPDGGTSDFTKNGSGTLTLSGTIDVGSNSAFEAVIQVNSGTIDITGTGHLAADLIQNFATIQNSGTINVGGVIQSFGTLTNASTGTITGGITQNFATFDNYGTMAGLQSLGGVAVNHDTGVINGSVQSFTSFTSTGIINGSLSNFSTALIENQLNGELANLQNGAVTTLTGITTGITNYTSTQGALFDLAGFNTIVGGLSGGGGDIQLGGATLTIDSSNIAFSDYGGSLTGSGILVKTGAGEQILRGVSTSAPIIQVNAGALTIADTGEVVTDVTVASGATFNINGALGGYVTNNGALNLGSGSLINAIIPQSIFNNSGGTVHAAGSVNGAIQNAGAFFIDNSFTGVTSFDQAAGGELTLQANFEVGTLTGSGTVDTGFYTLTIGSSGANATFDGTISGSGGLTKAGTGIVTLTAANTYTGDTLVSAGTLQLSSTGALAGHVTNNAGFVSLGTVSGGLTNTGTAVIRGTLNGQVENQGGVISLTGDTTGNGGIVQSASGIFRLSGFNAAFGSLGGAGTVDLSSGRLTVGSDGTDTSFGGDITGSGGLTKAGTGTMTLTGVNSYGGVTQITGGTLQLADGGEIGAGLVTNNGVLAFDGSISRTFGNIVQGSGSVTKTGSGLVTLTGLNGYSGGTLVQGGALGFDNSLSLGTGNIALADGTNLRNVQGGAAVTLANAVQIGSGGMATLQGIDGSSTTFNGQISGGTARFGLSGIGATSFTLAGTNNYGDTRIGGGVALIVGAGGTLGTGNTVFETSSFASSLTFNSGTIYNYGGVISGSGSVIIDTMPGASVTLSGSNTAAENFTGTVSVDSGKLVLAGDFGDVVNNSASLTLNGGSLGGSGTFHGDVNFGNATLNPGNSPGTLVIAGNLTFGAGTILNFELGEAGAVGGANNDLVNVGGNLTLDGTLNVTAWTGFGEGYYRLFNYGGTFTDNGLNLGGMPAGYTPTLLTNIAGQVNILFSSSPQAIQYWDGGDLTGGSAANGGDGGSGTWTSGGTNWTAPTGYGVNDSWRGQVAVFGGAAGGTVTVQGVQAFQELRFTTSGYTIEGASAADGLVTTGGFSVVDVSNGVDATINAVISGTGGLTKTGTGTLNLGGTNSYTGDTTVSFGTLALLSGGSLVGAVTNDAAFENHGTVAGLVTNNGTMISTGTLNGGLDNSGTASLSGALNGALTNQGTGTIGFAGTTTGIGAVTQAAGGSIALNDFDTTFGSLAGAGHIELGSATLTLGSSNASTSFDGWISGSGGLTKTGTGVFTLSGAQSYIGLTTVSAGTLQLDGTIEGAVRNDATFNNAGLVQGLVTNNGTLANIGTLNGGLNNSGTASLAGTVTGAVSNSGTISLIGTVTGIGAVTQDAGGSIALNGFGTSFGSLAGSGTVDTGGALFSVGGSDSSTSFAGAITGAGGLDKTGTGTFTLTGANSYTGLTRVFAGTLAVSATGSIAGNVRNQANFINAGTVAGAVQNNATLTSTGTLADGLTNFGTASLAGQVGSTVFNYGAITFIGTTTIASLQQDVTNSLSLGSSTVSIGNILGSGTIDLGSGTLSLGSNDFSSSFAGTISGGGRLIKTGRRTLVLTGAATHTGGTTISGGTLQIGNGGTTGSLSGAIVNNGMLVLNRSDAVTLANVMSGTGAFIKMGTGTATLTGANTYSGGTLVSAGRLRGDTNALQGEMEIAGAGTLEFAQTSTGTYAGSIYGTGAFEKTGTGTLNLTGNSAGYSGATRVIAGQMAINGLLSRSVVTVNNGATVSGTGTVGGLTVQTGGTIAPGNSVGTFNVAGNVLFQAGSLFAAEVQGNSADKIQATGTAQLNGTLQLIALGGNYGINSTFVLLHADGGVSGTFATANINVFGLAYRPKLIYTANEVQLLLAPNQLSAVLGTGTPLTYNQASTIGRLDAAVMTGGYDPTPLSALYSLAPAAIPAALDQLSGEIYADATRATLEDERVVREAVVGRLSDAAAVGLSGNAAWGQAIGSWGSVSSDGNGAGYDVNRKGFLMGIDAGDATEEGSWRAGVLGQYTSITVPASARGSHATIERTGGGFYAGAAIGSWRIRTAATLSLLDLKARRNIVVPGFTASERGKVQGVMLQTFGELSYRLEAGTHSFVEPYLAGSVSRVTFGRFAESSGPAALMVHAQKSVLGIGELGLRGEMPLVGGEAGSIRLGGNIGLRTAFGDRAPDPAIALAAAPGLAFNMRSAEIDRFAAAANLNLTADLSDKLSLRIGYSGLLSSGAREHGGRATLSLRF